MEKLALERGVEYVHKKLQEVDPESASVFMQIMHDVSFGR